MKTRPTIIEVRIDGKLHDLHYDEPLHAIKKALSDGGPYEEACVVDNPRGYDFGFLSQLTNKADTP